jgi:hypothetical protein
MSDAVEIALIGLCTNALPALASAFFAYRASVHSARTLIVAETTEKNTNNMKDELVALTAKSSHAAGVLEGKQGVT